MATPEHQQQQPSPVEPEPLVAIGLYSGHIGGSSVPQKRRLESAFGKQKPKVTRACDLCKAKKSKCSGELPCESCSRRQLHCQYEAVYLRGKAPTPRPAEPPEFPEDQQANNERHRTPGVPTYSHPILSRATSYPPVVVASRPSETRVAQEAPSRGSPGLEVAGQYTDSTSGLSFLHRAWRRISNNENSQVMTGHLGATEDGQLLACAGDKPFQDGCHVQLPSQDRGQELLNLYFDVCIATYRLLHRPSAELWLETVLENARLGRPLCYEIGSAKAATILSVLAIASFFEEKAKLSNGSSPPDETATQSQSDRLFREASHLTEGETGIPKVESAQSRLIEVLFLLMSCRFNQAWYTFGHALQIISALGLHRRDDCKRPSASKKRDYIEAQCKKRTFWVAYTLDKYLGVIFGRPRHYHDEDIDQEFPDVVNDEDMTSSGPQMPGSDDCHIESLVFHAKLAQIAERISREVYAIKPIPNQARLAASHRLGAELLQWRASLPPFLGAVNPSSLIPSFRRQATALKLSYCHAVMLAHRPFLLKNPACNNDDMRGLAKESLVECMTAAQSVLEVVDRMAREGPWFHTFWWTHYVCFCALVVVYVWVIQESDNRTALNERGNILEQAERCLQYLAQATASNSPSRRYSIILQELRSEAKRKTSKPLPERFRAISTPLVAGANGIHDNTRQDAMSYTSVHGLDAPVHMRQQLFGSPLDPATPGMQNFLDDWQTTDWLHLDSSAFGPFPEFDEESVTWMDNVS